MLTLKGIKSILRQIDRRTDRHVRLDQFLDGKKYILGSIVLIGLFIVFMFNSFATLEPVSSITIKSTTLDNESNIDGSWKYTKTAKWISKGKARINIKLETKEMLKSDYTDVILVLDTSGSMVKDKIEQLQTDVNEFINDTIPKGNKIALITFNDTANIVNDFTDDALVLQESISNLTASGETNYYQALVKVDEVLSTYTKEDNKNCVVLFLTDGLPTSETPSEVGEYKLLKEKYDYLDINGIQYELGNTVLSSIKNITDNQFIANTRNLSKFLYKAAVGTENYEKLVLTDYVDTNYFNLDNITNITTSSGNALIKDDKVTWNLDGLKSGVDAELTIDINLNNDLIEVGDVYPTHTKTDLYYKIGTTSVTETTDKTTILKDNYVVTYEANTPTGCVVSGVPSSKVYSVFDTVRLDDSVPTCTGYQFKEWKIVTDNVERVGNNQFIMPESNVTIKPIWKRVELAKSTDGKISKVQTLYKLMADNSIGLDTNIDFSSKPTDENSGIYTVSSTKDDKYPIHYYRGNINNNNVLFANFCWKMVITTSTGGVKLIYNGLPNNFDEGIPILQDQYTNVTNDITYPYDYDLATNKWTSTNKTHSSTGTISFSVTKPGTYILSYSVSSEAKYDKVYFYKDNVELKVDSGTNSSSISLGELTPSNVIMVKYTKDGSGSKGSDSVTFSIDRSTGNIIRQCISTGVDSQIGKSEFTTDYTSPSSVGYMYGTSYKMSYSASSPSVDILSKSWINSSSNFYYGDSITYSNGIYTLSNATQKIWSDNYKDLVGYYTCRSNSTTCSTVYYISGTDGGTQYVLSLSSGVTDPTTQTMTLSKGMSDNGDGTYSLLNPITIEKKDWFSVYSTYNGYYICSDLISTTCNEKIPIISTNNYQLTYDAAFNYVYGNDISWDGTKYILKNTFTSTNTYSTDMSTIAKKYHYTCLNTTGECTNVYYVIAPSFTATHPIFYLTLSNGKDIEIAKDEMFTNENDSKIKIAIDSWYEANMVPYTDRLEDTIWCNDRTIHSGSLLGKDIDFGTEYSYFSASDRVFNSSKLSIICPNVARDGFTVSTSSGGNGALTYPVGLLTADEIRLAGGIFNNDHNGYINYLYTGQELWAMSPNMFSFEASGFHYRGTDWLNSSYGVRPAVSLAPNTRAIAGDGTVESPYVIDDE